MCVVEKMTSPPIKGAPYPGRHSFVLHKHLFSTECIREKLNVFTSCIILHILDCQRNNQGRDYRNIAYDKTLEFFEEGFICF